jgi:hypothetical protein
MPIRLDRVDSKLSSADGDPSVSNTGYSWLTRIGSRSSTSARGKGPTTRISKGFSVPEVTTEFNARSRYLGVAPGSCKEPSSLWMQSKLWWEIPNRDGQPAIRRIACPWVPLKRYMTRRISRPNRLRVTSLPSTSKHQEVEEESDSQWMIWDQTGKIRKQLFTGIFWRKYVILLKKERWFHTRVILDFFFFISFNGAAFILFSDFVQASLICRGSFFQAKFPRDMIIFLHFV